MLLSNKQGEAGEMRKALMAKKEEVKEREKRIGELEKALGGENKKREEMEARMKLVDEELHKARQTTRGLQTQLDDTRSDARRVQASLAKEDKAKEQQQQDLLSHYRSLLTRVTTEYAHLASTTAPLSQYTSLKLSHAALEMHTARLERKLANSEAQAVELACLVRQTKEWNGVLEVLLQDAWEEARFYARALGDASEADVRNDVDGALDGTVAVIDNQLRDYERRAQESHRAEAEARTEFYRLTSEHLLHFYSTTDTALQASHQTLQHQTAELTTALTAHDALAAQLTALRTAHNDTQQRLGKAEQRVVELEERVKAEAAKSKEVLGKEKEGAKRTVTALQVAKMAEDGLRAEVERCVPSPRHHLCTDSLWL